MNRLAILSPFLMSIAFMLLAVCSTSKVSAEQYQSFGDIKVHYVVFNTAFLQPDIAENYRIVRARDRALVNISLIGSDGKSLTADLKGSVTNLLGQKQPLEFRMIEEGDARYYIATLRYTDHDTLRYVIEIDHQGSKLGSLKFQQTMYVEKE